MNELPLGFWGKARPREGASPAAHPLIFHMLDVAACLAAILDVRPLALRRAAALLQVDAIGAKSLLSLVAALHDLGKFAAAFQIKAPEQFPREWFACGTNDILSLSQHDADGRALWEERLGDELVEHIWKGERGAIDLLIAASVAHHGRPVARNRGGVELDSVFHAAGIDAARAGAARLTALLLPTPVTPNGPEDEGALRRAAFWFSGLITVSDWIGSNQAWFPYTSPSDTSVEDYWTRAQLRAEDAVRRAGVVAARSAPERSFREIAQLPEEAGPTPLQEAVSTMPLPEGPLLILIEDVTGAGKTEAAQMLTHRLMCEGRASGAYWGMPTQATANAMYARQEAMLKELYAPGARPCSPRTRG